MDAGALVVGDGEFARTMRAQLATAGPVTTVRLDRAERLGTGEFRSVVLHLPIPGRRLGETASAKRLGQVTAGLARARERSQRCVVAEDLDVEIVSALAAGEVVLFPAGLPPSVIARALLSGRARTEQARYFSDIAEMAAVGPWARRCHWTADQRRLLVLDLQGASAIGELAEITGKARGTVEAQLQRALRQVREATGRRWGRPDLRARLHRDAMRIHVMIDRLWDAPGDV